jgi:outer membrane protein OmpA-like peptidoglycan-associated protein
MPMTVLPIHPPGLLRSAGTWSRLAASCLALSLAVPLMLTGCASPPPRALAEARSFEQAADDATDALAMQTQRLPGFLAAIETKMGDRSVVLDPMLDASSGQQTHATEQLQRRVSARLANRTEGKFEVLPFQSAHINRAKYLLTGTLTRQPGSDGTKATQRIDLALTELGSGKVVAHAAALARGDGIDNTPLPYYRDSPVVVKDAVIAGYIRTTSGEAGSRGDSFYLDRIAAAAVINEATALYNAERYREALGQYRSALAMPIGEQLRVVNGIYLSTAKLGRSAEAEQAFGRVVAMGIAYNELGVKFLFNPGSTDFWSDPKVSGPYAMWLRQIGKEARASKVCLNVVGHTSNTGSEAANDALSLQRATVIRSRLIAEASEFASRSKALGMGTRQNIVGSGTDNAADALDRRVEFAIVPCG